VCMCVGVRVGVRVHAHVCACVRACVRLSLSLSQFLSLLSLSLSLCVFHESVQVHLQDWFSKAFSTNTALQLLAVTPAILHISYGWAQVCLIPALKSATLLATSFAPGSRRQIRSHTRYVQFHTRTDAVRPRNHLVGWLLSEPIVKSATGPSR
jgi:hypothetical protein